MNKQNFLFLAFFMLIPFNLFSINTTQLHKLHEQMNTLFKFSQSLVTLVRTDIQRRMTAEGFEEYKREINTKLAHINKQLPEIDSMINQFQKEQDNLIFADKIENGFNGAQLASIKYLRSLIDTIKQEAFNYLNPI